MLDKTDQSDRAPSPNEQPESCYCSALPKGSDLCLPCYTRWLSTGLQEGCHAHQRAVLAGNDAEAVVLESERSVRCRWALHRASGEGGCPPIDDETGSRR